MDIDGGIKGGDKPDCACWIVGMSLIWDTQFCHSEVEWTSVIVSTEVTSWNIQVFISSNYAVNINMEAKSKL